MASACARVRMPPEALTPIVGPTAARSVRTASSVAPPPVKPVDVLTKAAPPSTAARATAAARRRDDGGDLVAHGRVLPLANPGQVRDDVELCRAVVARARRLGDLDGRD